MSVNILFVLMNYIRTANYTIISVIGCVLYVCVRLDLMGKFLFRALISCQKDNYLSHGTIFLRIQLMLTRSTNSLPSFLSHHPVPRDRSQYKVYCANFGILFCVRRG